VRGDLTTPNHADSPHTFERCHPEKRSDEGSWGRGPFDS
jgi:hypothetical protein